MVNHKEELATEDLPLDAGKIYVGYQAGHHENKVERGEISSTEVQQVDYIQKRGVFNFHHFDFC